MRLKILVVTIGLLVPMTVLADTATDQLGPAPTQNTGPSDSVSQLLQPASPTTSQSLQGADAVEGGLPQSATSSDLQSAGNQDQFKVFAGQGITDQQPLTASGNASYGWVTLVILVLLAGFGMWYESRHSPSL